MRSAFGAFCALEAPWQGLQPGAAPGTGTWFWQVCVWFPEAYAYQQPFNIGYAGNLEEINLSGCCRLECETKYGLARGGGAIRRALFRLERGVCVKCRADCHALTQRLQGVEKGSRGWEARRRSLIARLAPRYALHTLEQTLYSVLARVWCKQRQADAAGCRALRYSRLLRTRI